MASLSMLIFSSNKVTSLVTEHHYLPDRDLTKLYQIQHPKPPITFSSIPCLTLETAWPELLMNNKYPFGDPHRNDGISSELISLPRRRCNISSHLGRHSTDPAARCPLRADPTAASVCQTGGTTGGTGADTRRGALSCAAPCHAARSNSGTAAVQ